ncbi:MAG: BspA family leucine-rich repeat surface protein [Anaerorhabdus sp.]
MKKIKTLVLFIVCLVIMLPFFENVTLITSAKNVINEEIYEKEKIVTNNKELFTIPSESINNKKFLNSIGLSFFIMKNLSNQTTGMVSGTWDYDSSSNTITIHAGELEDRTEINDWVSGTISNIVLDGTVKAAKDSSYLFHGLNNITSLDLKNLDTSQVTSMFSMFGKASSLISVDVSNWDTSNVTVMEDMFYNNSSLASLDAGNWDTSQVTSMSFMFDGAESLEVLNVDNWNTSKVTEMEDMFYGNAKLKTLNVTNWDVSNVTIMEDMFYKNTSLTTLDVSNWRPSKVTTMNYMFGYAESLEFLDVSQWDTSSLTNIGDMFNGASKLSKLDASSWDTSKITNMSYLLNNMSGLTELNLSGWDISNVQDSNKMFNGLKNLKILNLSNWNTINLTSMERMFEGFEDLTYLNVSGWNTSNVTNMERAFFGLKNLETLDVSSFDTSNVTNMISVFDGNSSLVNLNISGWDTSKVTNMSDMFYNTQSLITLDVSNWDTSNVTNMSDMFYNANSLMNLDVSGWDTKNVSDMSYMFYKNNNLLNLNVSGWDTSKVTNMAYMFFQAEKLATLDVSNWNISSAENISYMFHDVSALTVLDVSKWNTSNVIHLKSIFYNLHNLSVLEVGGWDTSKVISTEDMFYNVYGVTTLDVSNWNTSNIKNMSFMFDGASGLTTLDVSKWDTSNVEDMEDMFYGNKSLSSIDVSKWNTSKVLDMEDMFYDNISLSSIDVSNWDTSSVLDMSYMFGNTRSLENLDLTNWDTTTVEDITGIFSNTDLMWKITIGPNFKFHTIDSDFQEAPIKGTFVLNNGIPADYYAAGTKKWQELGTGSLHQPNGEKVTADQIMNKYLLMGPLVPTTYVWEQMEPQQFITGTDFTMYVGDLEPTADDFNAAAADILGKRIDAFIDLSAASIDTAGEYQVRIYSADGQEMFVTLIVKSSRKSISGSNYTTYVGFAEPTIYDFNAKATDSRGNRIDVLLDLNSADLTTPGEYFVKLYTEDEQELTVKLIVKEDKRKINGSDYSMYIGDDVPTVNNFNASATNIDGKLVPVFLDINNVDFNVPGVYEVRLYTNNNLEKTVNLTILEDQTSFSAENFTMYVGDPTPTKDSYNAKATDRDGNNLDITIDDTTVTYTVPGVYEVRLYTEDNQSLTVYLTIKSYGQTISGEDFTMSLNDEKPTSIDFNAYATDINGDEINVYVDFTNVNFDSVGTYEVRLYTDDGQELYVNLTIKSNLQNISGTNYEMYIGDQIPTSASFNAYATDVYGNKNVVKVDLSNVMFDTIGIYDVRLYTEEYYQELYVKLTIKENKQNISGTDFIMYIGDQKPNSSDFNAIATDKEGNKIDVMVDFTGVLFDIPGVYDVYLRANDSQEKIVKLTIKTNRKSITGSDFTMYVKDPTPTIDSYNASATDKDGNNLDITIDDSAVTYSKPGIYDILLKDSDGKNIKVKLTIKENLQSIFGSDFIMNVGDENPSAISFNAIATDKDGKSIKVLVDLSNLKLDIVGTYDVRLYTEDNQELFVTITVNKELIHYRTINHYILYFVIFGCLIFTNKYKRKD